MDKELVIKCPNCHDISAKGRISRVCYLNPEKGVYYCHRCGASGKLEDIKEEDFEIYEEVASRAFRLPKLEPLNGEAKRYLEKRFGILTPQMEALFRYEPSRHAIAILTRDEDEVIVGVKYRFIAPISEQRYIAEPGSEFGAWWLEGEKKDRVLVFEGEFDAFSCKLAGWQGLTLALQGKQVTGAVKQRLGDFRYVYVCPDNDEPGLELIPKLKELNLEKLSIIKLPAEYKDFNDYFKASPKECCDFLKEATKTEIEKATTTLDVCVAPMIEFLSNKKNTQGDSTGWLTIDKMLGGGLRRNEMTVINSFAKAGKTSFVNNLVHNLARQGKKIALASFEMDPAFMMFPTMLSIAGGKNLRNISNPTTLKEVVDLVISECSYLNNIVALKRFGITPWVDIKEWATKLKEEVGIEYLVLDHVGFLLEKMTDAEENQKLAKDIKLFTLDPGLHVLAVVQAPKTKDGLSIQTAYGGLAWGMNTDNFLILERDSKEKQELKVKLEASRYPNSKQGDSSILLYNVETLGLTETSPD